MLGRHNVRVPAQPAVSVRVARPVDVDDIAAIQVASWSRRFADLLPPAVLADLRAADLASRWTHALIVPPSRAHRVFVAVEADRVVGFASAGPADDPDVLGGASATGPQAGPAIEIGGLDVDPAAWGRGHGSRLLAAAADHAIEMGGTELLAWCAIDDEPRRRFLGSAGFGPDTAFRDLQVAVSDDQEAVLVREARLVALLDPR